MLKISDAIKTTLDKDEEAIQAFKRGLINFSSYAREIKPQIAEMTMKEVSEKTIIVALSRLAKDFKYEKLEPEYKILNISIHTELEEFSLEKTKENLEKMRKVYNKIPDNLQTFFTVTQSISEITVIGERKIINIFHATFGKGKDLYQLKGLAGITVKFSLDYLTTPNVIYTLIRRLALKKINIIEIVSSLTELTFIIDQKDTQVAIRQLSRGVGA